MAVDRATASAPEDVRNRRVSAKALHRLRKRLVDVGPRGAAGDCRAWIRGAPTCRSPARCCSTRSSAGSAPTSSRCAIWRCAKGWSSTTSTATARTSARSSAIPTSAAAASSSSASAAATGRSTRSRSRGWRSTSSIRRAACTGSADTRARVARVRRAAARRRRAHQLRAPPPALVLPDQERRPARLRSGGDRGHRARRPLSPPGDAEEVARGLRRPATAPLRRTVKTLSAMVRLAEGLDRSHAQALDGHRPLSARRRLPRAAARDRRRRARAVGRAPPRRAARARCSASRFDSRSPARSTAAARQGRRDTTC